MTLFYFIALMLLQEVSKKIKLSTIQMTQQSEKPQNQHQQLSPIEKEESHKTQKDEQISHQDMNNVLPLTHTNEKKKRKHRRRVKKYSPQHYEEIRIRKLNKKLQQKWDSHFINEQIPDLFQKKKIHIKTLSKLGNTADKRSTSGLNSRMPPNKPRDLGLKKETLPLPKILKGYKRSTSFNIHVVGSKQLQHKGNKQDRPAALDPKLSQTSSKKQKRISQLQKQQTQQNAFEQEYKNTLRSLFQQKKFLNCHKQILDLFIQKIGKKHMRQILDNEFQSLKTSQSTINKIMTAIQNRQKFIQSLNLMTDDKDQEISESEMLEMVDNYRTSTLAVVEEILKWKETWQTVYAEQFKKTVVFDLVYKAHNYLFTLASSVDGTIKRIHQRRAKRKLIVNDAVGLSPQEIKQKMDGHLVEQIVETTKRQTQRKTLNEPVVAQQISQNKAQQSNTVKDQTNECKKQNILLNDPFLISLFDIGKEDKNFILKIRACELLLIQEQFNFLKM